MKHPLLKELALVIAIKLVAIYGLWLLFFSPEHRMEVTPEKVEENFFNKAPADV